MHKDIKKLESLVIAAERKWKEAIKSLNSARERCERAARDHAAIQRDLVTALERDAEGK